MWWRSQPKLSVLSNTWLRNVGIRPDSVRFNAFTGRHIDRILASDEGATVIVGVGNGSTGPLVAFGLEQTRDGDFSDGILLPPAVAARDKAEATVQSARPLLARLCEMAFGSGPNVLELEMSTWQLGVGAAYMILPQVCLFASAGEALTTVEARRFLRLRSNRRASDNFSLGYLSGFLNSNLNPLTETNKHGATMAQKAIEATFWELFGQVAGHLLFLSLPGLKNDPAFQKGRFAGTADQKSPVAPVAWSRYLANTSPAGK